MWHGQIFYQLDWLHSQLLKFLLWFPYPLNAHQTTLVQRDDRLSLPTMSRVSCTHYDCFHECLPAHLQALLCSWCLSHNVKSCSSSMILPFPPSSIKWIIKLPDSNILTEQNRILNICFKHRSQLGNTYTTKCTLLRKCGAYFFLWETLSTGYCLYFGIYYKYICIYRSISSVSIKVVNLVH